MEPNFLIQSDYANPGVMQEVEEKILTDARKNLFWTIVRNVIITLREELKMEWIKLPSSPQNYQNKEEALRNLLSMKEFQEKEDATVQTISKEHMEDLFNEYLVLMRGNAADLEWHVGEWLSYVPGKKMLHPLIQNNRLFTVIGRNGKRIEGKEKERIILKNLLSKESFLPHDFKELRNLISGRLVSDAEIIDDPNH